MTTPHINVLIEANGNRRSLGFVYQSATHAALAALNIPLERGQRVEPEPIGPGRSTRYTVRSHIRELSARAATR